MKFEQFKFFFGLYVSFNSICLLQNWENLVKDEGYQLFVVDVVLMVFVCLFWVDLGIINFSLLDEDIMLLFEVREEYINGRELVY